MGDYGGVERIAEVVIVVSTHVCVLPKNKPLRRDAERLFPMSPGASETIGRCSARTRADVTLKRKLDSLEMLDQFNRDEVLVLARQDPFLLYAPVAIVVGRHMMTLGGMSALSARLPATSPCHSAVIRLIGSVVGCWRVPPACGRPRRTGTCFSCSERKQKDRLAAASPKSDQEVFWSGGCESCGVLPLPARPAENTTARQY
jgi:hypothetical protein